MIRHSLKYPSLQDRLVGAWTPSITGPTGFTLRDNSVRGNHGTLTNMEMSDWAVNGGAYALDFGGTNKYVIVPDFTYYGTQFTACCWMRRSSVGSNLCMFSHYESTTNNRAWSLQLANTAWSAAGVPDGNELAVIISSNGRIASTTHKIYWADVNICDGNWNHVGFTFLSGTLRLFVNGVERATNKDTDNAVAAIHSASASLSISCVNADTTPANLFVGQLDDLRMYNRPLSGSEFVTLATRRGIAYETNQRRSYKAAAAPAGITGPLIGGRLTRAATLTGGRIIQ